MNRPFLKDRIAVIGCRSVILALAASMLSAIIAPVAEGASERSPLLPILGNYPDTSLPLSTNTTITPDAAPTNTTRINVSTSTNFKGTLEGNLVTGVVRVTDAHPAGTYQVMVRAFDSGGASATKTFTLVVMMPATCSLVSFAPRVDFVAGTDPNSVAVGDFNGDGKQDLATTNANSNNVSILLGDGAGSFGPATNYAVGVNPASIALGDFNGDGNQDIAVANSISNDVSILLGDGAGNFSSSGNIVTGNTPFSVAVSDFNGDGSQDLVVANVNSGNVSILLGAGNGTFSGPINFNPGKAPSSVAVGDFNGDGNQDLAVADLLDFVHILLGDGAGLFTTAGTYGTGAFSWSVAIADFNNDGKQDLVVTNRDSNDVSILLGDGTGGFSAATNFDVGDQPFSAAVGDFNADGKQDLAVANASSNDVSILLGDGTGGFSTATNVGAGRSHLALAVGDFNNDSMQDLAVTNFNAHTLAILLRDCALTPSSVVSRKTHGSAGDFDINLPLSGNPGIECRSGGATSDHTMVIAFSGNVTVTGNPQAGVTFGTGTIGSGGVSNGGMVTINGNIVTIPLTSVDNAQTINITLHGVNGSGDLVIPMGLLAGDVNANGFVNASDVAQSKSRVGQTVDQTNFQSDVIANGTINASDVAIIQSHIGSGLP